MRTCIRCGTVEGDRRSSKAFQSRTVDEIVISKYFQNRFGTKDVTRRTQQVIA